MQHETQAHLFEVIRYCGIIQDFTKELYIAQYVADLKTKLAVERAFINIGEALVNLSRQEESTKLHLPAFAQVVAFRNVLVHNYLVIRDDEVWSIIQDFVPALNREAQVWLSQLENIADEK